MFRISNTLVGILNILTLLLSLAGMCGFAYIHFRHTDCLKVLQYPLLFGSVFIFVVSVLGIIGSLCGINEALYAYLLATFFVILGFMFFTVFALFVTNKVVGTEVSENKGFRVNRVADFSLWLQQYVINEKNWDDIKSCLVGVRLCQQNLSATQFGCCKPPEQCGFTMKNSTYWEVPKTGVTVNDTDCRTWNNKEDNLCYDCNSCKGEVLANIRNQWKHLFIFNVCVLTLLTIIYVLGCYAIRNNRIEAANLEYHSYGMTHAI